MTTSPGPPPADTAETDRSRAVALWWAPLDVAATGHRTLAESLSPEERQRAQEYRHPQDGDRFTAARGWLRRILGQELDCTPGEVAFVTGANGKPALADSTLRFNASRSGGFGFFVTSWTAEVGVDVEMIRDMPVADVDDIAARFFAPTEQRALSRLARAPRLTATFHCWTRKEAYVKGLGEGLSFPVQSVDVWHDGGAPATVADWTVHQVDIAAGFSAAVAVMTYGELGRNVHSNLVTNIHRISTQEPDPSTAIIDL